MLLPGPNNKAPAGALVRAEGPKKCQWETIMKEQQVQKEPRFDAKHTKIDSC